MPLCVGQMAQLCEYLVVWHSTMVRLTTWQVVANLNVAKIVRS
jgi:hypothetical protein